MKTDSAAETRIFIDADGISPRKPDDEIIAYKTCPPLSALRRDDAMR
jgi:hypothetical protein